MAQRNRGNTSSLMWMSLMKMTMRMMMTRKRSPLPMMTRRPPAPQTPVRQQGGIQAAADNLGRAPQTPSPWVYAPAPARSLPPGEFGPAGEPPHQAAGEHCSPGGSGTPPPEPSLPAVRAAPPAVASPLGWSCPPPSAVSPQEQNCPLPADTSPLPPRGDRHPSEPRLLFARSPPATTGHHKPGPRHHHFGYRTDTLATCPGRALVRRGAMSYW